MLFNKFQRYQTNKNWEKYRQARNYVTKIRRKSVKTYFIERCTGGCKSKDFWSTIKPFITNKGTITKKNTIIEENNVLVTDQKEIAEIFNDYYVNVASSIGDNSIIIDDNHSSINKIDNIMNNCNSTLSFTSIDESFVTKQINKMNSKKATGHDGLSVKMIKLAEPIITKPLTKLINKSIENSQFPKSFKIAQVAPIYKKKSSLDKANYRPVSLLPVMSKVFERAIYTQLMSHFDNIFNPFLSAFRPGYGCNTTLLKIVEDWKASLEKNHYVAAVMMDLSKAFDCLPHNLLVLKLKHYGLDDKSVSLIDSYLSHRKQCVRVGDGHSSFQEILKGVPQGSILGPVLFNIFINDIFEFVLESNLYNYADDNTLSYSSTSHENLVKVLEND